MMRVQLRPTDPRRGFTLVELLVAAALCILVMTILATAFQSGLETLSHLKSVNGLAEQLRAAEDLLRRDLSAQHLEDENGRPVRVSALTGNWQATPSLPRKGYFCIKQPSVPVQLQPTAPAYDPISRTLIPPGGSTAPYPYLAPVSGFETTTNAGRENRANYPFIYEGTEDGTESFRATDHTISMTVKLSGKTSQDVGLSNFPPIRSQLGQSPFSRLDLDPTGGQQCASPWLEVVWFLRPIADPASGKTDFVLDPSDPAAVPREKLQLYSLHRSQRVIPQLPVELPYPLPLTPAVLNSYREQYPDLSIASARPVGAQANLPPSPAPPGFPGYPLGLLGRTPWFDPTQTTAKVNTPESVTDPLNRTDYIVDWPAFAASPGSPPRLVPMLPAGYQLTTPPPTGGSGNVVNATKFGSDLVLNNVVSMEVRVITNVANAGPTSRHLPPYSSSALAPFGIAPFALLPRHYDTYYGGTVGGGPAPFSLVQHRLLAVQIKLRIYDIKNKMTRQVTITQDL